MKKLIFVLIASATGMSAAYAQGPYVGFGIATATHNDHIPGTTSSNSDGYKASGKLFGGYDLDKTWGIEAGYTDFRKSNANYTLNNATGNARTDGNAYYVAGKATAPLNDQFSVFGKLGVARTKVSLSASDPMLNASQSKTGLYAGLGGQYNLSKQVALTLEYERYGQSTNYGPKPNVWTVGAKYNF